MIDDPHNGGSDSGSWAAAIPYLLRPVSALEGALEERLARRRIETRRRSQAALVGISTSWKRRGERARSMFYGGDHG